VADAALPEAALGDAVFLAGLRISGGLSLIGAVVAEFVAGTGGSQSGLGYRILESGYQLRIPRMFAALLLISLSGILLFWP
jgi:NitT/TauT family transport system permease protein